MRSYKSIGKNSGQITFFFNSLSFKWQILLILKKGRTKSLNKKVTKLSEFSFERIRFFSNSVSNFPFPTLVLRFKNIPSWPFKHVFRNFSIPFAIEIGESSYTYPYDLHLPGNFSSQAP